MKRVAVVVPCHDDGDLAAEAVASVDEREPVEIVVVDDGSTAPASLKALEGLEREGVRVERREQGGPAAARMTGVAATTAPFVYPLDADDVLVPGALGALADALDAAPDAAFAWGDYEVFGDYSGRYRSPQRFLPWSLTYVNVYPISSLIRRTALEDAGGWRSPSVYEDWDLWLAFAERGMHGVAVDRVVYRRRLHGGGRMLPRERGEHSERYDILRGRHPSLFDRRAALRAAERPPLWKRAAYPLLFGRRALLPRRIEAGLQALMLRRGLRLPG